MKTFLIAIGMSFAIHLAALGVLANPPTYPKRQEDVLYKSNKGKPWRVCQGSYGVIVCDARKGMPGGRHWHFDSQEEAIRAAALIKAGTYERPCDDEWIELPM
jgi:hypothetical protein